MRKIANILIIVLLIGLVNAHPNVSYTLIENRALVEINFGEVSNLEFKLPYDAQTIEANVEHEVIDMGSYKLLKVSYAKDLYLSYITESVIDQSSKRNYFILGKDFAVPISLLLILPQGSVLEDLIFPSYDLISTDGKNIILGWNELESEEVVVSYKVVRDSDMFWYSLFILLIIIFSIFYVYQAKKMKRKLIKVKAKKQRTKDARIKDVTRNLFGEEKKIIEYLFDKKRRSCWTKEIVKDLGISKVRLSRKLRKLKQKGLIEKIPHGNENRIKLLKTH